MDYRELLKKYIDHVAYNEGVTFLDDRPARTTDEEWAELQKLDEEGLAEARTRTAAPKDDDGKET